MRDMAKVEEFRGAIVTDTTARGEVVTDDGDLIMVGHDWLTHHPGVVGRVIRKTGGSWELMDPEGVEDIVVISDEQALDTLLSGGNGVDTPVDE